MNYKLLVKTKIVTFIVLLISVYGFGVLYIYLYSKDRFLEDKVFKSFNMNYHVSENEDYIIIGSSKVKYGISTNEFKKNNLNIYNYGKSGMVYLYDFPYVVNQAILKKPKHIILSIDIEDMYRKKNLHRFLTYYDAKFIEQRGLRVLNDFKTLNDYLFSYISLKDIIKSLKKSKKQKEVNKVLEKFKINYSDIDCIITNISSSNSKNLLALCSNGDALYFSKEKLNQKEKVINYRKKRINGKKNKVLKKLIERIKQNGITPIVIIEPYAYNKKVINYKLKQRLKNTKVIDLVNYGYNDESMWADKTHFNSYGRIRYTSEIIKSLKNLKVNN